MGIKHCEYIDPNIINEYHNEVDFDSDDWIKTNHKQVESKKSKTYAYV
jgi:hypothetical protein